MAGNVFEEVLRIVLETQGQEGLDALRQALDNVGDVSDDTLANTKHLVDALGDLNTAAAKSARFQQLSDELERTTQALDHASREAIQLNLELAETENPSKQATAAYKKLREEVDRLEAKQRSQTALQEKLGAELRESGVDTTKLADANRILRTRIDDTTASLRKQTQVVEQEAAATRKQRDALDETNRKFREFVAAGDASAAALKKFRDGAESTANSTGRLANEGGRLQGMFSGLRSLIGPVIAYLSFDSAIRGIQNLAGIGSAAEDARRALVNLYGSTEAGNRAYEGLRDMARASGLAFGDLVNDAKRLKAFGLDPLNGSLQALIDQNASVGGSQQDLSGKVLALGQAWAKQKLQGEEILQLVERGVPVWDLLQKATGKNVQELQKLSEQGKLGRDVIRGLYEELGRANTGAAERGLSSLSGLMAQMRARWEAFLQLVADNGVTDYFRQQMASLLGATGSMDQLAKRVADGVISSIEALKRFGQQMMVVLQPIGSMTLALARNAEAVLFLAKVYAGMKIAGLAQQFSLAAAAAAGMGTAASTAAGGVGTLGTAATGLGAILGRLPRVVQIGIAVAGLDYALSSFIKLNEALEYRRQTLEQVAAFERADALMKQDQLRLGQQLQTVYKAYADTVIQSGGAVSDMTRAQAQDYQFALEQARQYYGGVIREARAAGDAQKEAVAREQWDALAGAITGVKDRLKELGDEAAKSAAVNAMVDKAVAKFDELASKAGDTKKAVAGIFDGLDLSKAEGVRQASAILEQVGARGKAAGDAVRTELSGALAKVSQQDLPALKAAADAAMAAGQAGARSFAEAVAQVNLQRLGVDISAIKTGFTEVGRSAVDAFRGAIKEVDALGLTVQQRSAAIAQAFDNAFRQASTKAELAALKAAIQDALSAGDIGFAEFSERVAQVDAKLAEVGGTGKQMGAEVASGAGQAGAALGGMSSAADQAASSVASAGDAAAGAAQSTANYGKTADGVALTTRKLSAAALEAYRACNQLSIGLTGIAGKRFADGINRITQEIEKQGSALDKRIQQLEREAEQMDENYGLLEQLRRQYHYLAEEEIQRLFQAEVRLKQLRDQNAASAVGSVQSQLDAYAALANAATDAADAQEATAEAGGLTQRSSGLTGRQSVQAPAPAPVRQEAPAASASSGKPNEVVLRVVTDAGGNARFSLSQAQLQEIATAVVRLINQSRSVSA